MVVCWIGQTDTTLVTYRIRHIGFLESLKLFWSNVHQVLLLSTHCEDWLNKKGKQMDDKQNTFSACIIQYTDKERTVQFLMTLQSTLLVYPYLEACKREANRDVQRCIDDACYWFDQRHEEQREPDDADEQHNDHATHSVLHHLLLLLTPRLRKTLEHTHTHNKTVKRN